MTLPAHFFTASDGALFDTRDKDWSTRPLRPNYVRTAREITHPREVLAALRSGPYAWPGGYALYFTTTDGATLSFEAVRQELRQVLEAVRDQDRRGGWTVNGVESTGETDARVVCDHTGEVLSAGAEDVQESA